MNFQTFLVNLLTIIAVQTIATLQMRLLIINIEFIKLNVVCHLKMMKN